ncbi:MAG: DNA repair protein RadA [Actinomycetota bacterium]|nr:MAG: DNA repair protein RadA [Actinomycetota bacterium]
MGRVRTVLACSGCGQQLAQWAGRCPGCGAWGTIRETAPARSGSGVALETLEHDGGAEPRVTTGLAGLDRVLGGGLVPASVVLLAGEPGIGKSTLLLQLLSNLATAGRPCLLASGEESRAQVAARARRLGVAGGAVSFVAGRELGTVLDAARSAHPFLVAVDSIQTLRDPDAAQVPGGPAQVRSCTDALVGLAKELGIAVVLTGHVTKDGDLAGPRTLEHAVDVVLSFDGDPRSGLRVLAGGKNRFGAEGEVAWFEMTPTGLVEIDPTALLVPGEGEPGAATALPRAGRRALALEVQALVAPTEGTPRRQVTGLDGRRFQLVAAVLERAGVRLGRSDLFGAASGGGPRRGSGVRPGGRGGPRVRGDRGPCSPADRVRGRGRTDRPRPSVASHGLASRRGASGRDRHGLRRRGRGRRRRGARRPRAARARGVGLGDEELMGPPT